MSDTEYRETAAAIGVPEIRPPFADDLFRALGAAELDVMDASAYEGANLIHDLNQPVDASLHGRYDCVIDGGSLEHVFNFPIALKSCMEMVRVGGSFLGIMPANSWCGHGFYQFGPELLHGVFARANGFLLERLLFVDRECWYSVPNPAEVRARVELRTSHPILFFVSAKRVEDKPIFQKWPQQSDYLVSWQEAKAGEKSSNGRSLKESILDRLAPLRSLQTRWREFKELRRTSPGNRAVFTPISLDSDSGEQS